MKAGNRAAESSPISPSLYSGKTYRPSLREPRHPTPKPGSPYGVMVSLLVPTRSLRIQVFQPSRLEMEEGITVRTFALSIKKGASKQIDETRQSITSSAGNGVFFYGQDFADR